MFLNLWPREKRTLYVDIPERVHLSGNGVAVGHRHCLFQLERAALCAACGRPHRFGY
jgi:hypothetical protein